MMQLLSNDEQTCICQNKECVEKGEEVHEKIRTI